VGKQTKKGTNKQNTGGLDLNPEFLRGNLLRSAPYICTDLNNFLAV
jgi:hypothetical protein